MAVNGVDGAYLDPVGWERFGQLADGGYDVARDFSLHKGIYFKGLSIAPRGLCFAKLLIFPEICGREIPIFQGVIVVYMPSK